MTEEMEIMQYIYTYILEIHVSNLREIRGCCMTKIRVGCHKKRTIKEQKGIKSF